MTWLSMITTWFLALLIVVLVLRAVRLVGGLIEDHSYSSSGERDLANDRIRKLEKQLMSCIDEKDGLAEKVDALVALVEAITPNASAVAVVNTREIREKAYEIAEG